MAAVENRLSISQNVEHGVTIWPSNSTCRYIPGRKHRSAQLKRVDPWVTAHDLQVRVREKAGSRKEVWTLVPGMWMSYLWRGALKGWAICQGAWRPSFGGCPHEEDTELWPKGGNWIFILMEMRGWLLENVLYNWLIS